VTRAAVTREDAAAAVQARLDAAAKPRGSLAGLEALCVALAHAQASERPRAGPRRIVLFAADHGCVASGVSAWPSAVTRAMIGLIAAERAASSAMARTAGADLRLVDTGSLAPPLGAAPGFYREARVAPGSADLAHGPALTPAQWDAAWAIGADEADRAAREGFQVVAAGEMGIGNTTPAACLTALLAGIDPDAAVGPGAGADDAILTAKRRVVSTAVDRAQSLIDTEAKAAIASVGGLELAAMAGFYAQAARHDVAILLDGYVATAAALAAERLVPGTAGRLIAAHRSAEPGHRAALAALGLTPLLDLGMRLGEGTGALAAMPLLDMAVALLDIAPLAEVTG